MNLGMLVEINLTRAFVKNVKELAKVAIETGKEQIARFNSSLGKKLIQIDITTKVHPAFGCTLSIEITLIF